MSLNSSSYLKRIATLLCEITMCVNSLTMVRWCTVLLKCEFARNWRVADSNCLIEASHSKRFHWLPGRRVSNRCTAYNLDQFNTLASPSVIDWTSFLCVEGHGNSVLLRRLYYLRRRLASEDILTLGVMLSRCVCVRRISLGGEGNPVLSSCVFILFLFVYDSKTVIKI